MEKNELQPGAHRTGMLVDGIDDTPFVVGTLTHAEGRIECSIPFVTDSSPQFASANQWFAMRRDSLPRNLVFHDERGVVSLFGIRAHFSSIGMGVSVGKFTPAAVVFAKHDGDLGVDLTVEHLRTKMDGLADWVAAEAISVRTISEEGRLTGLDVSVRSPEEIQWSSGDAQLTLDIHWEWTGGRELRVTEYVLLHSKFRNGKATPEEHLQQHRMVRALIAISSGGPIVYRKHWVKDELFPLRMLNGRVADTPWQSAVFAQTLDEHGADDPRDDHMLRAIVTFEHLGAEGMEAWSGVYQGWRRPIDFLFGLLSQPTRFIEDRLLAASMTVEAAGHLLGPVTGEPAYRGRNVPFANQVYRCLHAADLDPTGIATSWTALATAAAAIYRRVKHPEHEMPDSMHSMLLGRVLETAGRAVLIKQIPQAKDAVESFMRHTAAPDLSAAFRRNDLFIDSSGHFVASDGSEPQDPSDE